MNSYYYRSNNSNIIILLNSLMLRNHYQWLSVVDFYTKRQCLSVIGCSRVHTKQNYHEQKSSAVFLQWPWTDTIMVKINEISQLWSWLLTYQQGMMVIRLWFYKKVQLSWTVDARWAAQKHNWYVAVDIKLRAVDNIILGISFIKTVAFIDGLSKT